MNNDLLEGPLNNEDMFLLKKRSRGIVNYIVMLVSLGEERGMSFSDIVEWIHSHYEERGYYDYFIHQNGYGNVSEFLSLFVEGRKLLYDRVEIFNQVPNEEYEVLTYTWYDDEPPETFFYFDFDAKKFSTYASLLAIKNAKRLGIDLTITKENDIERAIIKVLK